MTRYIPTKGAIVVFRSRIGGHPIIAGGASKLDSAMAEPAASWDGVDLHATIFVKAAVLMRGIAVAHAFEDGNKRLAWLLVDYFMHLNRYMLRPISQPEIDRVVRSACEKDGMSIEGIAAWLEQHSDPYPN